MRIRAAAYPRCSDENLEGSDTLESQTDAIRLYCEQKGYELEDCHIYPEAMTGYYKSYRERPQLMRMLDDARRGMFDVVVVNEFSRLSRKQIEQAVIIDLLERAGVRIESVTEKYDTSPIGIFMRSVYALNSELEHEKILERTSRGRKKKIQTGKLLGQGESKYGYMWNETRTGYIPDPQEYPVVEKVFDMARLRISQRKIALTLEEDDIPTRRGGPWLQSMIRVILTDRCYIGEAYWLPI